MKNTGTFKYAGAMVLGMHDALVSLIGVIVGLTFALADRNLIVTTGIISSVAAGLSMTASSYLAAKAGRHSAAMISAIHTGIAYIATSAILLAPFMMTTNTHHALYMSFMVAVMVIFVFNCCITRGDGRPFVARFTEMLAICAGVSAISCLIGQMIK